MTIKSQYKGFRDRFLRRMAALGTDIRMDWVTLTGTTFDPTTQATTGTPEQHSETIKGYVHFPDYASRTVVQFAEIEVGDVIVDLPPDVTIEGRDQLTFTINGEAWVQKKIGTKLAKSWDVVFENSRFCRTLLLRKAT